MPPIKSSAEARQARRHNPLEDDLGATGILRNKTSKRKARHEDEEQEDKFIDSKASKKILRLGQDLAAEEEAAQVQPVRNTAFDFDPVSEEEDLVETDDLNDEAWGDEDEEEVVEEIDVEDMEAYRKFFPETEDSSLRRGLQQAGWSEAVDDNDGEGQGTDLAALILERIAEHEAANIGDGYSNAPQEDDYELPPKVVEVYTK